MESVENKYVRWHVILLIRKLNVLYHCMLESDLQQFSLVILWFYKKVKYAFILDLFKFLPPFLIEPKFLPPFLIEPKFLPPFLTQPKLLAGVRATQDADLSCYWRQPRS